jgi:hypothetical protein
VVGCQALYDWSLIIDYTSGAEQKTHTINGLRSGGGIAGVPQYEFRQGTDGRRSVVTQGASSATCPPP